MYSKVCVVALLMAVAHCQEHSHSYSLKSIVKHEEPKKVETYHSVPVQTYHTIQAAPIHESYDHGQSHGHAVSSQSIIRHDSGHKEQSYEDAHHYVVPVHHAPAPVHETYVHSAPVQQIQSSGHGHAVSSQSIVRHDSGHKEQSYDDAHHYVVPVHHAQAPVHETYVHSAPVQQIQSSGHGHAVSSQSIVRHDSGHKEQSYEDAHHYVVPVHHAQAPVHETYVHSAPVQQVQSSGHGHAVSSQSIVRHDSHKQEQSHGGHYYVSAPTLESVSVHAPAHKVESHGHAVSSQSVIRHDDHQGSNHGQSNEGSEGHYFLPIQHAAPVYHAAPVHKTVSLHSAPVHYVQSEHSEESHHEDYYAHPKYEFEYKIEDPHTGDNKFQHEARDGDKVEGVYSLHEADGSIRTVKYSADKHSGFNAEVSNSGVSKHIEAQSHHH